MIISAFVEVLLPVLVVVACGYALRRVFPIDVRSLNRVSMYVLSPALIFTTLARIEVAGAEALRIAAVSTLVIVLVGVLTYICARPLRLDQAALSALLLSTMFMNAGNYGLPTTRFAFGEDGLQRALLFFIPQTILAQVLAVPIAGMARGARGNPLLQVLRMPQIYAALAGLLARAAGLNLTGQGHDVVTALFRGVALMSDAALPLLLLLLGMQLAQGVAVEQRGLTTLAVVLRLLVSPLLAYGLAQLLGLSDLSMRVVVLEASMPTAVNMVLYSLEFDARPGFVAGVVVVTTLLSLGTLTLLLGVLRV
jgi:predicted permease